MDDELQALQENFTWDIVPRPRDVKHIGSKWVYSINLNSDGTLNRYKARLVAFGNKHCCLSRVTTYSNDENFAPVAKMTSIWTILTIVASQ